MPLPRRLELVTADDIIRLVEQGARESSSLDYKGRYNFRKPTEKLELRKDLAAMATQNNSARRSATPAK